MEQSRAHWHPWGDDPDQDDEQMTDEEFTAFVGAVHQMRRNKDILRQKLNQARKGVPVPKAMPKRY